MLFSLNIPQADWDALIEKATLEKTTPEDLLRELINRFIRGVDGEVGASVNARLERKLGQMSPSEKLALARSLGA